MDTSGRDGGDWDAIVVGAGHNGLVTAAYLARAGLRTLLLEARSDVGGTAASESFGGTTVNICNCDHLTFRTTPVIGELGLADHGLRYLDVEPAQHNMSWAEPAKLWSHFHDVEATVDSLAAVMPDQADGYRRYAKAAIPAIRMVLDAACEPPSVRGLTRVALHRKLAGASTLLRWSRRSTADVLRSVLRRRRRARACRAQRPDGVGNLAGDPRDRAGRPRPRDAPRRHRRASCRRQR